MGKKRNGFREVIRDSLPEPLVKVLKKHKCLTSFIEEYESSITCYVDRKRVLQYDIRSFENKDTRRNTTIMKTISRLHAFEALSEAAKLD